MFSEEIAVVVIVLGVRGAGGSILDSILPFVIPAAVSPYGFPASTVAPHLDAAGILV